MDDHKASDNVAILIEEGIERFEKAKHGYSLETDQPKHASWIIVDAQFEEFGIDSYTALGYKDDLEMQSELLRLAKEIFTPELLWYVRSGNVTDLTLRIGANTLWATNLNEEGYLKESD